MKIPVKLLKTEWPNEDIKPGNERFDKVFESVKEIGIQEPLTINMEWMILAGNHRLAVAKKLNIKKVEVQVWTGSEMVL